MKRIIPAALVMSITLSITTGCSQQNGQASDQANNQPEVTEPPAADSSVSETFRSFLDKNYDEDMVRNPLSASYRGIKTHQDKWNNYSEADRKETREINETRLEQLQQIDRSQLSDAEQLSWDLYQLNLQRRLASDEFRHHHFVIHQFRGPHTFVASALINVHTIKSMEDAKAYIQRLNNVGTMFDEVIEQMQIREQKNLLLADWKYPQMITASKNIISGYPYDDSTKDSTLWADFQRKVQALEISDEQRNQLLSDAEATLVNVVKPAYLRLIAEMESQSTKASGDDGVWKFERGDEYYAERLRWFTTTDLTADQIHNLGLQEVARIHDEMRDIMDKVDFEGSLSEFFIFMREDEQFYYPNTDEGREAYLAEVNNIIADMYKRLPEVFGKLPKANLIVKRVEAFRERSAGKAFYQGPPADGSRPAIYYANLYNMADMPKYEMAALAYHEAVPGHHLQISIAIELEDVPKFQRYSAYTAFTEGWGLYAEELPKDMGMYQDPYADFGRLAMELWRACRLVVDTGLHSKRWTREQAIDYLMTNTPNSIGQSTKAIERYIAMPGQATAYLIGKLKIVELREKVRAALGEKFDIGAYHDLVLKDGPMPLSLLEIKVNNYIAENVEAI